jgi:hypothetical protein
VARPIGESTFKAPVARPWAAESEGGDEFERSLLGFCVGSILDQRVAGGENRTYWAGRLGLSKSHISKMTESPTPAFIERFVLELKNSDPENTNRLVPLLSDFYADIRPPERHPLSRHVLKWFARFNPHASHQLTTALFMSEVALEKCRMLERAGGADYDDDVRESLQELMIVTSGPYGGSLISLHQCAEIGLLVPTTFLEEVEQTLNTSPLGFRMLRTLDRFVRLWQAPGPAHSRQRQQGVEVHLPRLIGKLASATSAGSFIDPYPGREWGTALAGECLKFDRSDLTPPAVEWLRHTIKDPDVAERGRLHAAWVLGCARADQRDEIIALLAAGGLSMQERWLSLIPEGFSAYGAGVEGVERDARVEAFGRSVRAEFVRETSQIRGAIDARMPGELYAGLTRALSSLLFAALVTPDGRHRRALIEAVANAGLVAPTADVLCALLGLDGATSEELVLVDAGFRETAIFLLGRLRQPKNAERVTQLARLAGSDPSPTVRHAAVWAIGDLWRKDLSAEIGVLDQLKSIATSDDATPWATKIAAAHALAIIAHDEAHPDQDRAEEYAVSSRLLEVQTHWTNDESPGAHAVRAICYWGTRFDATGGFDIANVRTLSGLLEGHVSELHGLGMNPVPAGPRGRAGQKAAPRPHGLKMVSLTGE